MWITQKENNTAAKTEIEVTCALIMDGQQVLVTQRSEQMPHPLKWEFPGGKLRSGESPELCIVREIREELGIGISLWELLPTVKYTYGKEHIKLIPFICKWVEGEILLAEHQDFRWVHLDDLELLDWLEADVEIMKQLKKKYSSQGN